MLSILRKARRVLDAGLWSQQCASRVAGLAEPCPALKVPQKYLGEELGQALRSEMSVWVVI